MIYFVLSEQSWTLRNGKYPKEFAMNIETLDRASFSIKMDCERIFAFHGENTVYYKNRWMEGYQYTPEEQTALALRTVLIHCKS